MDEKEQYEKLFNLGREKNTEKGIVNKSRLSGPSLAKTPVSKLKGENLETVKNYGNLENKLAMQKAEMGLGHQQGEHLINKHENRQNENYKDMVKKSISNVAHRDVTKEPENKEIIDYAREELKKEPVPENGFKRNEALLRTMGFNDKKASEIAGNEAKINDFIKATPELHDEDTLRSVYDKVLRKDYKGNDQLDILSDATEALNKLTANGETEGMYYDYYSAILKNIKSQMNDTKKSVMSENRIVRTPEMEEKINNIMNGDIQSKIDAIEKKIHNLELQEDGFGYDTPTSRRIRELYDEYGRLVKERDGK